MSGCARHTPHKFDREGKRRIEYYPDPNLSATFRSRLAVRNRIKIHFAR